MTEKTQPQETQTLSAFTRAVMSKIDYHLSQSELKPFSPDQLAIIEKGISACQPKTHAIDVRGVLPFHFMKIFYVFLLGHDQRGTKETFTFEGRQETKPLAHVVYWAIAIWPFYVVTYFIYWILNHLPPLQ